MSDFDSRTQQPQIVVCEIRLEHASIDRVLGYEVMRGTEGLGMFGTRAEAEAFRSRALRIAAHNLVSS